MMMYEINMTIFGRVELSNAIYPGPSEGLKIRGGGQVVTCNNDVRNIGDHFRPFKHRNIKNIGGDKLLWCAFISAPQIGTGLTYLSKINGHKFPSMTQLSSHTLAHLTVPSFSLKAKLLPNNNRSWSCQKMSITKNVLLN